MSEYQDESLLKSVQTCCGEKFVDGEFAHELIILLHFFSGFFEACVCDETDCCVEPFRLAEDIEGETDSVAFKLSVDAVEGIF